MGTTLLTFKQRLRGPLGRDDSTADAFIARGVNFGCILAALLFDPPELSASGSLAIAGSGTSVPLTTLTRLRLIKEIYNSTGQCKVWEIPFSRFNFVVPAETGNVRFYARDGNTLHVKPSPVAPNTLLTYYNQFPAVVDANTQEISITDKDSLIESYALAYAFGCLEETEQGAFWQKLGDILMVPEAVLLKARRYLEGGPSYGDDKSGT
jgi:hypothetical protein